MKYKDWLDVWFANYIEPSSKTKTCERYSEIIEKHLKVKFFSAAKHEQKLVPAVPYQKIIVTNVFFKSFGDRAQNRVAHIVSEKVVINLKIVYVYHRDPAVKRIKPKFFFVKAAVKRTRKHVFISLFVVFAEVLHRIAFSEVYKKVSVEFFNRFENAGLTFHFHIGR